MHKQQQCAVGHTRDGVKSGLVKTDNRRDAPQKQPTAAAAAAASGQPAEVGTHYVNRLIQVIRLPCRALLAHSALR